MLRPEQLARPNFAVPAGACDCHMHVFGAVETYPPAAHRVYTPTPAPLSQWRAMAAKLGLTRVVMVQPSAYGSDNRAMLDALGAIGPDGRGIAVIDEGMQDAALAALAKGGVRGIRLNVRTHGEHDIGDLRRRFSRAAERIGPLGWHIQIYADLASVAAIADIIRAAPVPVVLDHMGGARAALGIGQDGFRTLLDLLGAGRCWVKVSGAYRVSDQEPGFADATPIARALVQANPERLVWGTDWPHIGSHADAPRQDAPPVIYRDLDTGALMNLFGEAAGDAATRRRILVDNPARLYGF
ncbi:MAG TPA: amidohydrolase family protein [Stellaceae bacterium]|nr:amidohydrolase family protein [Stellaceae bacterium]